jgi:nitrite reductase/ring-hydroxylating ferredoxin subunit/uncharacterized membrane protein
VAERLVDRLVRSQNWMDRLADFIQKLTESTYKVLGAPGRGLRNLLHGTTLLGHPLHPAVTDLPIGAWTVGVILDYVAVYGHAVPAAAGDIALLVGVIAALLATASGYTDFNETVDHERRVALTHGLTMSLVVVIEIASLLLRWLGGSGAHPVAIGLATAGLLVAYVGGYLGGHVVFSMGTAVNRNAFYAGPQDFVEVGSSNDFPENQLRRVMVEDLPVLLVRQGGRLCAIGAVCSHAGGPLDEGTLDNGTVTCPWHGSKFDICTGAVKAGPATFDEPQLTVREVDGRVSVKPKVPLH